jgi:replicative DNA helicase
MKKNYKKEDTPPLSYEGRVPPRDVELEGAVLGACIVDGGALADVSALLAPERFDSDLHRAAYDAMLQLYNDGSAVDLYTVVEQLRNAGKLEEAGGAQYMAGLTLKVASGAHAVEHARVIVEKYALRRLVEAGHRIASMGFNEQEDVAELLAQADTLISEVSSVLAGRMDVPHVSIPVAVAKEEAHARVERVRQGKASGCPTGLTMLDRITGGWQPSNLIILAARPAMGKTALMLHFAKAASKSGVPVAIFSLEMSEVALANRLILSETDVAPDRFRSGYMNNIELDRVDLAAISASVMNIYIDSTADVGMAQIRAKARTLHRQGKCGVALIDYLQLCRERGAQGRNREQEVAAMSREAKIMAKELGIPVILLSQLSREVEKRGNKKPTLSDLRESGAIEQDADIVMFIYRPSYYEAGDGVKDADNEGYGELLIEKNRDGATGKVPFSYSVGMARIEDVRAAHAAHAAHEYSPPTEQPIDDVAVHWWKNYLNT